MRLNDALGKWLLTTDPAGELLLVPQRRRAPSCSRRSCGRPGSRPSRPHRGRTAGRAGRPVDPRGGDVLLGGVVSAARRYRDLLSRQSDLRDGAVGRPAQRKASDGGAGPPCWLASCGVMLAMRPIRREPHPAGADRAVGSVSFRLLMITTRLATRDIEYGADFRADRRHAAVRRCDRAVRLGHAVAARFRAAVAVRRAVDHGARLRL